MPTEIESNGGRLRPFQPGQSGNPGGKTSEQRKLEIANAEKATRIRAALLAKIEAHIDPATGAFMDDLSGELLKLIKDSEDRGLGAPQQNVEVRERRVSEKPMSVEDWAKAHGATD